MSRHKAPKTQIICTLGPASSTATMLNKMAMGGMDVVRLNFSHGSHDSHLSSIETVRRVNSKHKRNIKILADLEGHRIRVGILENGGPVKLIKKQKIVLTSENIIGTSKAIPIDYHGSFSDIKKGYKIYIEDGNLTLKVLKSNSREIVAEVQQDYFLKQNKGINIPQASLIFPDLEEKDRRDIEFAVLHKVDFIAQSFVRTSDDIQIIRNLVSYRLPDCKLIAKIESKEGIDNVNDILKVSDGLMIARGDMGVSLPIYTIPIIQKYLISRCRNTGKFSITATQMLESMTENKLPTRAETTDVANAILDGSDYVMLSGETAVGKYPDNVVRMMNNIIWFTEKYAHYTSRWKNSSPIEQAKDLE